MNPVSVWTNTDWINRRGQKRPHVSPYSCCVQHWLKRLQPCMDYPLGSVGGDSDLTQVAPPHRVLPLGFSRFNTWRLPAETEGSEWGGQQIEACWFVASQGPGSLASFISLTTCSLGSVSFFPEVAWSGRAGVWGFAITRVSLRVMSSWHVETKCGG